jgi:glycerol-3-phosphate dehydrogenase
MAIFANKYGSNDINTLYGLSGIGDLMLTSFGSLSRNRTFGFRIAKGEKVEDIVKSIGTVEGVYTLKVAYGFAK